jgi:hypothetical protein
LWHLSVRNNAGADEMVTAAVAVVGVLVAANGQQQAKKAQKNAANQARLAALQSADLLDKAGRAGEADIMRQSALAEETSTLGAIDASTQLDPFADLQALERAQDEIIGNLPVSGAIADSIRAASTDFIRSRPEMFNLSPVVSREVDRQGDLSVSAASPDFKNSLLAAGQEGLAATSDQAQIKRAGLQRLSDLAGSTASQRAGVLVGAAPQLAQLQASGNEARLLSSVAGQRANTQTAESVAGLAGQLFAPKVGLLRQNTQQSNPFGVSGFEGTGGI